MNNKEKIVVLNSGGFDSTLLIIKAKELYPDSEIHSMYFSYGQPNGDFDSKFAKENADKVGAVHHTVVIPKISWSKLNFYSVEDNSYERQYLEMRNLIFISYAMSMAEAIEAKHILMAILKGGKYPDTSPKFISIIRQLCKEVGIGFETPFIDYDKSELYGLAKVYKLGIDYNFISCDTPKKDGEPCGQCLDCRSISDYFDVLEDNIPIKAFYTANMNTSDPKFRKLFTEQPISEIRILLNNDCQLDCPHCYHRNNDLIGDILTDKELFKAIDEAYGYGIREFHFAGKEPLYNERIFRVTDYLKTLDGVKYHVVTNGINVPKYADKIKSSGISKVFLSTDNLFDFSNSNKIRSDNVNKCVKNAVECLSKVGVPVEIFYDLTTENVEYTLANLIYWNSNFGVKDFFVRTIRNIGIKDFETISNESLNELHNLLLEYTEREDCDFNICLSIGACPYTYNILLDDNLKDSELVTDIYAIGLYGSPRLNQHYSLVAEAYCAKYENQITLTPDGYVLGCAMECSVKDYDKVSAGNIKSTSLIEIINKGKIKSGLATNDFQTRNGKIFFEECVFNPIDFEV